MELNILNEKATTVFLFVQDETLHDVNNPMKKKNTNAN